MDVRTKEIYSEVYEILMLLGDNFINKLPQELFELIKSEKMHSYSPQYDINFSLQQQNIKKESIAMLALFYLNYWCDSEEEKNKLKQTFKENEEKYQKELREHYNPDNIFKNKQRKTKEVEQTSIVEYKVNIFKKIINKIKEILHKNKQIK